MTPMSPASVANMPRRQTLAARRESGATRQDTAIPVNGGTSCTCGGGCPTCTAARVDSNDVAGQAAATTEPTQAHVPAADGGGAAPQGETGYDKTRLLAAMAPGQDADQAISLVAADPTAALDDLYVQSGYAPFWNLVEKSAPHDGATKPLLETIFENYQGGDRDKWSVKRRLLETQFGITVWKAGDPDNVEDVAELDALYAAACTLDASAVKAPNFVAEHRKPGAPAAPPTPYNAVYGGQNPNTAVGNGSPSGGVLNAEQYRDKINTPGGPEMKPASEYPSLPGKTTTKSAFRLTKDELLDIVIAGQGGKKAMDYLLSRGASADPLVNRAHAEEALAQYMQYCQAAFETMMIDTVESQALFIAHAAGETIFAKLTEGQTDNTFFESDPDKVKVSTSTASVKKEHYPDGAVIMDGPMRYGQTENKYNQAIDSTHAISEKDGRSFDKTFIGRGPIQVTLKENYVQTLAFMDKRAIDLRAEASASGTPDPRKIDAAVKLEAAVAAIRAQPRNAADPQYAFLFSAAFMQMGPMAKASANGFTNSGMTGGYSDDQGEKKKRAYAKAVEILMKHKATDDAKAGTPK
jgi:hypothetical protein